MTDLASLLDTLPTLQRIALAYCPAAARQPTLALFAFDARIASLVRRSSEPMLAQIRIAWWRETLSVDPMRWPEGEPLLVVLRSWEGKLGALAQLADGWEAMTDNVPLSPESIDRLATARGAAFATLSEIIGVPEDREAAARQGKAWSLADIASGLTHPEEKAAAQALVEPLDWQAGGLSRKLRPLAVLHGLAARSARRGREPSRPGPLTVLAAIRLGLLGR